MRLHTCSEVLSFARQLENESANFYEKLAQRYLDSRDFFLSLANENRKYTTQVERAYYGVITDAIESCFAFDIGPEDYALDTGLAETAVNSDVLDRAIEIEDRMIKFYSDAAEQSRSLMADVPRAFRLVVKKRDGRKPKLKSLLEREG